jgi:hypothetical protein
MIKIIFLVKNIYYHNFNNIMTRWPSGLRRQFKALVFGRGFESHSSHDILIFLIYFLTFYFFFFQKKLYLILLLHIKDCLINLKISFFEMNK